MAKGYEYNITGEDLVDAFNEYGRKKMLERRGLIHLSLTSLLVSFPSGIAHDFVYEYLLTKGFQEEEVAMTLVVLLDEKVIVYNDRGLLQSGFPISH